jgi:hypothetical protein
MVTAGLDGLFGLALGMATIRLVRYVIAPAVRVLSGSYRQSMFG